MQTPGLAPYVARNGKLKNPQKAPISKTGDQCHIHVFGKAGFALALDRESADETKIPTLPLKKDLQFSSFLDKIYH